jgi:benzoyl-CoA reductase/2-hydroxyglutaryl-CoA dehydratase subunit BcrC/BadD/HgdB
MSQKNRIVHGGPVSAFDEFTHAYRERDRAALEWKAQGGQVVGCLGSDVPEELLIAAGFLTVRVCGDPGVGAEAADRYIERAFDPLVRSQFARIVLDGAYSYLDHLIVSRSSDALVRVFYYLRELRRLETNLPVPDLYFFDLLHSRYRTSALYNRDRARDLKRVVEGWCGRPLGTEGIAEAIATCEENRGLLRRLAALRAPGAPRVSGVQALQVIGASMFLPREEHSRLLRAFLAEAEEYPPLSGVRLFVTGSAQDHAHFYELVESCGAVVVGEDHDWGNRHFAGEIDTTADPTDAIVDRYHLRSPSTSRASVSARVTALVEQVRAADAQGVVFYILEKDDAPSWDFPEQRKALEAAGIPVLLLDRQPYQLTDSEGLRRDVGAFVESIVERDRPAQAEGGTRIREEVR